jgi:hypothetical protein
MTNASRANITAISAGVLATFVNAILFTAARIVSLSSFNPEALLAQIVGALFGVAAVNGHIIGTSPSTWVFGLLVELVLAGAVGWFYAKIFQGLERSGWDVGLGVGAAQWLLVGGFLGLFPDIGFYGSTQGWPTFVLIFASQILFGSIVGGLYVPDDLARKQQIPQQTEKEQHKDIAA